MDGYVTDHIEILQDHSALFRGLAFFEEDLERRCKMHKRRIDMLEPICNGAPLILFLGCRFYIVCHLMKHLGAAQWLSGFALIFSLTEYIKTIKQSSFSQC